MIEDSRDQFDPSFAAWKALVAVGVFGLVAITGQIVSSIHW